MDAARYDMVIRSGTWDVWKRNKWFPVVASQRIRFRKSLAPWTTYTIRTRTLGWDERNLYIGQVFERAGVVHAEATIRASILQKGGGKVSMDDLMRASGWPGDPPILPERVRLWVQSELMDAA